MWQQHDEQFHVRLLNTQPGASGKPQIFYNFNRELMPSSSPGLMFIAGMLFESRKLSDAELRAAQHELDEFEEKL